MSNVLMNLRAERLNRGLSLRAAAELMDVDRGTLAGAEAGTQTPHPPQMLKIAKFYDVQVTDIWPVAPSTAEQAA